MYPVTNVSFDRLERQVFERARIWSGLASDREHVGVLRRLAMKDPTGIQHSALVQAHAVLADIMGRVQRDLEEWRPLAATAPETADEFAIIANPRQAAQMIVDAREMAERDITEALALVAAALGVATSVLDDIW